jgi:non-ribosomal peptide synthetase component F/thioesterase domain-containing protein
LNSVAVIERTRRRVPHRAGLQWLADGQHPLDWNGPITRSFTRFRDEDLDRRVIDHFERIAGRYPNRIAVTDSETSLTYAELWNGLSGLAERIAAETKPGDLIGIALPACSMFPLAMLASLAAGRPFVALDPHYPDDWQRQVLEDAQPALIIRPEDLHAVPDAAAKNWRPAELGVDDPACVVFTSGSTGRPKGIVNSQRNLLQRVAQSINAAHINAEDRFLTLASPCTIVGVRDIVTALLAGASMRLLDPQRAGAREIVNVIGAERITVLFAFPALLRSIASARGARAAASLRLVRVGGDTTMWTDIETLRAWLTPDAAIQIVYAATEAPMMQWFVDDGCRREDVRVPIGYPLPGNVLALVDEDGRAAVPGEVGELIVASRYVSLGRWFAGRVDESVEIDERSGWRVFRTGDLVRQRTDGLLERVGRRDRQAKIRGSRVDLDGVEALLHRHPSVRDVAIVARPDGADGTAALVAYVASRDGAPAGLLDELKASMRSAPSPMRPTRFYIAPSIPRLPNAKLDVRALAALDEANARSECPECVDDAGFSSIAGDRISQTVARVWQHVLHVPVRRAEDDFFDSGGDSLSAITFMLELEHTLGLELPLTLITEAPAFGALCSALSTGTPSRRSFMREHRPLRYVPLVPLKAGDGGPPVFIVHGIGGSVAGLLQMARRMNYPGAVIGIQARGLDGREEPPHATVEAMAAEYVRAVKARQADGPYYLCGYSFGGLVAFEMARRLRESGDEVALVGLFDTTMSPLRRRVRSWLSAAPRRMVQFAAAGRVHERLRRFLKGRPVSVLTVTASALIASVRYRPAFYAGELTLFAPVERSPGLPPLDAIWRDYARTLSIVETAGTHSTMFSATNAESTAASLTQRLRLCGATTLPLTTAAR